MLMKENEGTPHYTEACWECYTVLASTSTGLTPSMLDKRTALLASATHSILSSSRLPRVHAGRSKTCLLAAAPHSVER